MGSITLNEVFWAVKVFTSHQEAADFTIDISRRMNNLLHLTDTYSWEEGNIRKEDWAEKAKAIDPCHQLSWPEKIEYCYQGVPE